MCWKTNNVFKESYKKAFIPQRNSWKCSNPDIKQQELADVTGKSLSTIKRLMKSLQDKNYIRRESGKRYGKWKVLV